MSTLPTCNRLITALTKESAYGTAIADGSLNKMFPLTEAALANITLDTQDGRDILKGHEFNDPASDPFGVLFQNVNIPLSGIPASAEWVGWSGYRALGGITSAQQGGTVAYKHTLKMAKKCSVGDQYPSSTLALRYVGSDAASKRYKGAIFNNWGISVQDKGRVTCSGELITDGTQAAGSGISVPASFHPLYYYFGSKGVKLEYDTKAGGVYADKSSLLRSFELTVNNNLLVDEAKTSSFATLTTLPELRTGDREITANLTLLADEGSTEYGYALAATKMQVRLTLTGDEIINPYDADCIIEFPEARWTISNVGYDGTRRVLTVAHTFYWNVAADSPLVIEVYSKDTAYA